MEDGGAALLLREMRPVFVQFAPSILHGSLLPVPFTHGISVPLPSTIDRLTSESQIASHATGETNDASEQTSYP